MAMRIDMQRTGQAPAIAAAQHTGPLAQFAQEMHQRQYARRLAGAADMIIADADHRNAGIGTRLLHPLRGDGTVERGDGRQQS